jgi:chemotaxis protein MotA
LLLFISQVMQHLENITEVGTGIAVAFVATIYGVGSANILFLPWAGKLKIRMREKQMLREMTLEGVISIVEGLHPRAIESKLLSYFAERRQREGPQPVRSARKAMGN